ncbi:MAG: hypothetical protein EHM36_07715 [Deltaproteobacteria bacterium]|nr:MAG: hypothetical protein EHM36_07715 [Deltaproteobacteria bacterium]
MDAMGRVDATGSVTDEMYIIEEDESLGIEWFILFLCWAAILALVSFFTYDSSLRDFYERCVDEQISQCERNASLTHSTGESLGAYSEQMVEKANFYKVNRDALVHSMDEKDLGKDPQGAEHFLHKAYAHHSPKGDTVTAGSHVRVQDPISR